MLKQRKGLVRKAGLRKKPSVKPKPKTKSISQLKKEADRFFSLATRYRFAELIKGEYVASCITCGMSAPIKQLQCGHFMSRRFNATRFLEENTAAQCVSCNIYHYGEQYKFGLAIDDFYGDGTAKKLQRQAKKYYKFNRDELLEIIHDSKEEIDFYEKKSIAKFE